MSSLLEEMMQVHPEEEDKARTLAYLTPGTTIKLTNGDVVEFVEMKRKNFIGIMNGKGYKIPCEMYESQIAKPQNTEKKKGELDETQKQILNKLKSKEENRHKVLSSLKKGDYFYINSGRRQNAELYIFEEIKNSKVIGINPITKVRTRIDMSFDYYKLDVK